jgi:hypothetical protein
MLGEDVGYAPAEFNGKFKSGREKLAVSGYSFFLKKLEQSGK